MEFPSLEMHVLHQSLLTSDTSALFTDFNIITNNGLPSAFLMEGHL